MKRDFNMVADHQSTVDVNSLILLFATLVIAEIQYFATIFL